jgi:hypothetical protein
MRTCGLCALSQAPFELKLKLTDPDRTGLWVPQICGHHSRTFNCKCSIPFFFFAGTVDA